METVFIDYRQGLNHRFQTDIMDLNRTDDFASINIVIPENHIKDLEYRLKIRDVYGFYHTSQIMDKEVFDNDDPEIFFDLEYRLKIRDVYGSTTLLRSWIRKCSIMMTRRYSSTWKTFNSILERPMN